MKKNFLHRYLITFYTYNWIIAKICENYLSLLFVTRANDAICIILINRSDYVLIITLECIVWPTFKRFYRIIPLNSALRIAEAIGAQLRPTVVLFNRRRDSLPRSLHRLLAYLSSFHPSRCLFPAFSFVVLFSLAGRETQAFG